jgi:hypothetical protein
LCRPKRRNALRQRLVQDRYDHVAVVADHDGTEAKVGAGFRVARDANSRYIV